MKIAICFSGAIREFIFCYPSIYKYLIKPLNADIFAHLWSISNTENLEVKYKFKKDLCNKDYVINKLKSKKCIIHEYNDDWEKKILNECNMNNIDFINNVPKKYKRVCNKDKLAYKKYAYNSMGMYYKILKCNELKCEYEKENNFEYDIVIRARVDFLWHNYVTIDDLKNIKNNIILSINDDYIMSSNIMTNDKFFAGSSKNMNKFCNLFNKINFYHKNGKNIQGSDLFIYHLNDCNFKLNLFGDRFFYNKYHYYFNKVKKLEDKILIEINNVLDIYISESFLKKGYLVHSFGLCSDILNCYLNH